MGLESPFLNGEVLLGPQESEASQQLLALTDTPFVRFEQVLPEPPRALRQELRPEAHLTVVGADGQPVGAGKYSFHQDSVAPDGWHVFEHVSGQPTPTRVLEEAAESRDTTELEAGAFDHENSNAFEGVDFGGEPELDGFEGSDFEASDLEADDFRSEDPENNGLEPEREGIDSATSVSEVLATSELFELETRPTPVGAHRPIGVPSPWPDAACPASEASPALQTDRALRLAAVIEEGVLRKAPHAKETLPTALFSGSFDWHSAVHAHWALLSIARVEKFTELEGRLEARLTAADLSHEFAHLDANTGFEQPYGRAWLVLMLAELERHAWRPPVVVSARRKLEVGLCRWLESSRYPEGSSTGSPTFFTDHFSWLFALLLLWLSKPEASVLRRLEQLFHTKVEPARAAASAWQRDDFLHLPAVQATLDRIALPSDKVPAYPLDRARALLQPPIADDQAHSVGAEAVRLWPRALDARRDPKACARFQARIGEFFHRPDQWADSFAVSHWVPQFLWMALWLERGRP